MMDSDRNEPRRNLPSLTALRAFEAVGRTGSVRAAGDEIGVTHTAISRHLRHLQQELGVALVRPDGRGLSLTPSGRAYHADVSAAFSKLHAATMTLRGTESPRLNVWCIPGIVNRRLLPRLPEISRLLPKLEIDLQPTLAVPRLAEREADAVLIYDDRPAIEGQARAESIVRPRVYPVASPAFLDRHPSIRVPADLAASALLHEESHAQWEKWFAAAGLSPVPPLSGQRLWHAHVAIEAARLGQGVAMANDLLVAEELRSGALVEVLETDVRLGSYQIVSLASRWNEPAQRALRRWLKESLDPECGHW